MSANTEKIATKDYWTIMAMEACGHVADTICSNAEDGDDRPVLMYTFPKAAEKDFDAWMRGEIRHPFDVIRKVQQSATQFKNNLHRYCK